MSRASGDSRIPTARRSGLPRPAPPQLRVGAPFSLAGGSGPFSLSPAAPPEDPPDALPPPKLARFSTGDLPECAPRRCIAPPRPVSSGGRLGSISSGEARAWGAGPSTAHDSPFSRQLARVTHAARRHDYHDDDDYPQDDEDDDDDYPDYPAPPPRCLPPGHPLAHPRLHHAVPPVPRLREASRPWEPAAGESACRVTREGVGRRVVVGGVEGGTLRYVGRTAFAAGEWAGVELDRPAGKNDGSVDGVIYFSCRARHGIFAPVTRVALAPPEPAAPRPGPVPAAVPGPGPGLAATATSGSLPRRPSDSSPEGAECPGAARAMRRVEEGEEGCAGSPGSPGDATCDDSSLGILTPDQMPDFTVTASASLGRSPSDEDVAALEDEVCEAAGGAPAVATAVGVVGAVGGAAASGVASGEPLPRWDSDPSVAALDEELFRSDVSAIIRELRSSAEATAAASTSSGGSSPSRPRPSPDTERFQQDEARLQREHDDDRRDDRRDDDDPRPHGDDDQRSAAPDPVPFSGTVPRSPACPAAQGPREAVGCADLARLPAAARRATPYTTRLLLAAAGPGEVTPETEAAWAGGVGVVSVAGGVGVVVGGAAMTTSAGSLDQGYQGDAECDPRSEGGTGTASSPTEDVRLFQGVMDDVSLGEDDHEADHPVGGALRGGGGGLGVGGGGDRSARIIDGKLYHAPRELARPHDPSASEMDSSGFYSDLDPRDRDAEDESARTDLEPVQEALGGAGAAMHDSLLEDDSRGGGASLHDSLLDDDTRADHSLDDDRSSASTLRPESKDPTLSEAPDPASDGSAPPGTTTLPDPAPGAAPAPPGTTILPDATTILPDTVITAPAAILPAPDTAATTITAAPCTEVDSQATPTPPLEQVGAEEEEAARARARTYDKPWLARPPPPRRKEEPRRPLPPPPPMPKRNVQSRLKALLEAPREAPPEEARRPRQPRKNRWDEVMTKIAEGQREAPRGPPREVKSRLMEGVLAPPAALSPQAERIRQERRERRERRQAQQAAQAAAAAAAAARRPALLRGDRKRSTTSIRSNRTSRAPSLDSLPADYACSGGAYSRGSSADRSETSHKSSSTASGGGGSRASRDSRVISSSSTAPPLRLSTSSSSTAVDKKLRPDPPFHPPSAAPPGPPPRRPRLEIKTTIPKTGRHPQRKTDPVKAPRPAVPQGVPRGPASHNGPQHHAPPPAVPPAPPAHLEVRRLQAEAAAARREKEEVVKAVEALTVIIHHLANTYDPFSTPRLKADVKRLNAQLTETRLNLDESSAAVRRLQEAETDAADRHEAAVRELEARHTANLGELTARHAKDLDRALEKHRKELAQFTEDQQTQREAASRAHATQLEQVEEEWRAKLDLQHEKHLCALQELNTQHMHQVRDLESSRRAKERQLEEANQRLVEEQTSLRQQAKKLEETLLNDTDHRLAAVRRMCASLKSEVDSLKSVVEMKNSEIHSLRSQVVEVGRLTDDLDLARERARALQAKTEDLQAQMEKKAQQERSLVNEHRLLVETYQRESNVNKRLSLENEELTWKLRQREELIMTSSCPAPASSSSPSSSLDLVTRAPVSPRPATPQGTPRSPRVAPRGCGSVSPCKSEPGRRRHRGGCGGVAEVVEDAPESPPPSPCVKAVVEKSNSVSFILELTGGGGHSGPGTPTTPTSPDNPFHPLSPRRRPHRTASLSAADRPRPSPTPAHARRAARPRAATLGRGARLHHDHNGGPATSTPTSGGPHVNGRRSASESSEGGVAEGARVSPTGLAWTVPVRGSGPAPPRAAPRQLLQDPQEDEYECAPRGQAPPRFLDGAGLTSSSEAASDSELSQCSLKGGSSPEDDDDDDDDDSEAAGAPRPGQGPAAAPRCPKDGAGEAMIPDELLQQYGGAAPLSPPDLAPPRGPRRRLPSAPSSDSDENTTPHNDPDDGDDEAAAGDASWSEDVDVTSSSELHDDL